MVTYLHLADYNPWILQKLTKILQRNLIIKDIKFPVKTRGIHKIKKKKKKNNYIGISVFFYENNEKHPVYASKTCWEERYVDLSLIGEESKIHYAYIKDINTFMYDHTLHHEGKHFWCYCLQAFSTEEMLKCHINDCFEINGKQRIKVPKEDGYVIFKHFKRKIRSPFLIYADFESFLVPEADEKQNTDESYTNVVFNYGYNIVHVDDKFTKSYLGKNAVHIFINIIIEDSKYCSEVIKKHFNKELVIIEEDDEDFENYNKCWICDNACVNGDVKIRDHCHITWKYRDSSHGDCNININLNHKIPVTFYNLKNYDWHLVMQELGKSQFKINVISNWLEQYLSYSISDKFSFVARSQFLSSSLDRLVKNLDIGGFNYSSQEFVNNVFDLVEQKGFYPYEYIGDFKKFKEQFSVRKSFIVPWLEELVTKSMNIFWRLGINLKWKR